MHVAVVGSGIAGLTAALRLAQRGYQVTVYEEKEVIGGNLSSQKLNDVYHDVYPHMFCDWYVNFWKIFESDLGLDRNAHFEPRAGVKLLRKGEQHYLELKNPTTLQSLWGNLRSGVLPFPDMFLLGFSLLDLAAQPFKRSEVLSQLSVNGFLNSRSYITERCAELHDLILMEIWSIHGDLTSATSYKDFVKHTLSFPRPTPFAWLLKGNLQEKLIEPLQRKLEALGCSIRTGRKVKSVQVTEGKIEIKVEGEERPQVDYVVLAVPAEALAKLVTHGERRTRIVDRLPQLSELRRLRGEQIAVVDLYFKRKLAGIPREHVGLSGSDCDLTFLDISQLWVGDHNVQDRTALVLAASDFYALPSDDPKEDGHLMIKKLHEYLPVFDPGERWGDPKSDICWEKSRFQPNHANKLFINEVGSWGWRPSATYEALPNVFFAGDFCRTDVDMATVEAAVLSGLQAAQALWKKEPLGPPIAIAESEVPNDTALLAAKLALIPYAYWAKWWSIALDAVPELAQGNLAQGLIPTAAGMLLLPLTYTVDWWETAYAFWKSVLFEREGPKEVESATSRELPIGAGSTLVSKLSSTFALATELWRTVRSAYTTEEMNDPDEAANAGSYHRRWRVKR